MGNKEYFIFGEIVSADYYYLKWSSFLVNFKKGKYDNYQLYDFDWSLETGEDLLKNYEGYIGFAKIRKEEYEQLSKIENE